MERETAEASSLVLDIPAELERAFAYEPGQFLTLEVDWEGTTLFRCYSLASSPQVDREAKLTVKRVEGGRISNWINDNVREGDTLTVWPPAGQFTLATEAHDIVLFAGGSGITPCISIVKSALAGTPRRVRLVYANRDRASVIFGAELDRLAAEHPRRFEVAYRFDDEDGFVDAETVRARADGRAGAHFYVCGPAPFMDVVENTLHLLGVARENILIERFSSPPDGEVVSEGEGERALPATGAGDGASIELVIDGTVHTTPVADGETILQAARNAGLRPPYSCQSGFCGCCMAKLTDGEVTMKVNDFLEADDLAEGWVLTCQAVPKPGRCRVEYPD